MLALAGCNLVGHGHWRSLASRVKVAMAPEEVRGRHRYFFSLRNPDPRRRWPEDQSPVFGRPPAHAPAALIYPCVWSFPLLRPRIQEEDRGSVEEEDRREDDVWDPLV